MRSNLKSVEHSTSYSTDLFQSWNNLQRQVYNIIYTYIPMPMYVLYTHSQYIQYALYVHYLLCTYIIYIMQSMDCLYCSQLVGFICWLRGGLEG